MPTYAYVCDSCGTPHEEFRGINAPHPEKCPSCGEPRGDNFRQDFRGVGAIGWVYGNPTTVGQQAELNAKRVGKERMAAMAEEDRQRVSGWKGKLPAGASPNTTGTGETPWFRDGSIAGMKPLDKPLDTRQVKDVGRYIETGETT